jgi:hypothetical protein
MLDEHLLRLVEHSCRIRLVLHTCTHDRICLDLDTYPDPESLEQANLQHSKPAITEPCVTSPDFQRHVSRKPALCLRGP